MHWIETFNVHMVVFWTSVAVTSRGSILDTFLPRAHPSAMAVALGNQYCHLAFALLADAYCPILPARPWAPRSPDLTCLTIAYVLIEVWFYVCHKMFHLSRWLYKNVHKHHHAWTTNLSGIAALDLHPVEHLVCNIAPLGLCIFLLPLTEVASLFLVAIATWNAVVRAHGQHQGIMSDGHDLHHELQTCNFGVGFMFMDRILGTHKSGNLPSSI